MKNPANEEQLWAIAYGVALALLTLGNSIKGDGPGKDDAFAAHLDKRAALIADKATERLKDKLP